MYAIFDAPSREECTANRARTNTPLQALTALNDPTFVEAARVLGQKVLAQGPADDDGRLVFAFRTVLVRPPSAAEHRVLKGIFDKQRALYRADPASAARLVKAGRYPVPNNMDPAEHAAWTAVANVLLNLDETITRE
jgi:hypothetical protein